MVAAPAATSVHGWRKAASPATAHSDTPSSRAIQVGGLRGTSIRRHRCQAYRTSATPRASFTAKAAVDGAVLGAGGFPCVVKTTHATTKTKQASQPSTNTRPLRVPFSLLSSRMNAVSGNGSRLIPRPMSTRLRTTGPPSTDLYRCRALLTSPAPRAPMSQALLSDDPPGLDGFKDRVVVTLVLVGVGVGELRDGLVEDVRAAQVSGDGDGVSRPGVGARQGPSAHLAVHAHATRDHGVDVEGELPVPQLADVEVTLLPVQAGRDAMPPQEDVTGCLHQPLARDHPLAHVGELAGAEEPAEHRLLGLLDLEEQRIRLITSEHQHDPAPRPDTANADDLPGHVNELILLDQVPPVGRQRPPVFAHDAVYLRLERAALRRIG